MATYDPSCVYCQRCGRCSGNGSYMETKYGKKAGTGETVSYQERVTCSQCDGRGGTHKNSNFKCPSYQS